MKQPSTSSKMLSLLLTAFALFTFGSCIVSAFIMDALIVDVTALIVAWLAVYIRQRSRRAHTWALIFMGYYVVVAAMLLVAGLVAPSRIRLSGRLIEPHQLPYALAFAAIAGCWALTNFLLLWKHRAAFRAPTPEDAEVSA